MFTGPSGLTGGPGRNRTGRTSIEKIAFVGEWVSLAEHLATFTGIAGGVMVDTAGNRSGVSIIESGTLIKRPDGWKLLCGQSAALPPAEQ